MITVGGIILCGGQSSRMGRPKPWLPFGNEPMLQRVVRIMNEVVRPVVIVAASEQKLPPLPSELTITRDEEQGRGPLQGLAGGLAALHGQCEAAFVTSCDVPFLQPAFIRRMIELLGDYSICVPRVNALLHPLGGVYRLSVAKVAQRFLNENRLRLLDLFDEVPTRIVEAHELSDIDPGLQSLRNLNSPEDYESALRDAGITPGGTADPNHGA